MKLHLLKGVVAALFIVTAAWAKTGLTLYGVEVKDNDKEAKHYEELAVKKLLTDAEDLGFTLSDPHERINDAYKTKYGSTTLFTLNFMSISHDETVHEIMQKHPQIGAFSPFNMYSYKLLDENMMWVGHVDPDTISDMVGLKDEELRKKYRDSFAPLDELIQKTVGTTTVRKLEYKELPKEPLMVFEYDITGDDIEDWSMQFQEAYEEAFEEKGYIIAGYRNFWEFWEDEEMEHGYDAYWVYSLCHFPFSNAVFNKYPDMGAFAPCSVYMYSPEGSGKLYVGMPKLENWVNITGLEDKEMAQKIIDLDQDVIDTMNELKEFEYEAE